MQDKIPKGSLLVVDDDEMVCEFLTRTLSDAGYECQICTRAESALEMLNRKAFDAVILDMMMPGITGLEVLMLARTKHPRTAFIVLTGMDDVAVATGAMKQGADDYLLKPCKPETVIASVDQAIRNRLAGPE